MKKKVVFILAKILMSGVGIVDMRGKFGGSVAQKGRTSLNLRNKVTPVNRRTSFQQNVRSFLSYLSSAFRALSPTQIAEWNSAAADGYTARNVFGNTYSRTGHQLFVNLNFNLGQIAQPVISSPPAVTPADGIKGMEPTVDISSTSMLLGVTFTSTNLNIVPTGNVLLIRASRPLSASQSFSRSKMRVLSFFPNPTDTDTSNLWPDYVARFGAPLAGQVIYFEVACISTVSGQAGVVFQAAATVTT